MAEMMSFPVRKLTLDVFNFRTMPQTDEVAAIHALIAIDTDWFWALMESLIDTGYLPTENIIALRDGRKCVVKEGNRRIAVLKIIHGYIDANEFELPDVIKEKLLTITPAWKRSNLNVPCSIYEMHEAEVVDRIVSLTHGKGDKAGRAKWKAIARARHNRTMAKASEPGLDLVESFLSKTKKISEDQKERWSGDYPVTILHEAIKRLAGRLGYKSAAELAKAYPKIREKAALEEIILDIGHKQLDFKAIRAASPDFGVKYGLPPAPDTMSPEDSPSDSGAKAKGGHDSERDHGTRDPTSKPDQSTTTNDGPSKSPKAHPAEDPKAVASALKKFIPRGNDREKLATLLKEIKKIDLAETPHAFCFLLRSMFEVSAKSFCAERGIRTRENNRDRSLLDLLKSVVKHITDNHSDMDKERRLYGAIQELNNPTGILSVVSMNQLIHNSQVIAKPSSIAVVFHHVFPLLEEMNK